MMNHAVGVLQLNGNFGQCEVQRGCFGVLRPADNLEQQQGALGNQPGLSMPLKRIQIDAEIDVALGDFNAIEAEDTLAETKAFEQSRQRKTALKNKRKWDAIAPNAFARNKNENKKARIT